MRRLAGSLLLVSSCSVAIAGCGQVPVMRGEIEGLRKVTTQAERNGALRCAPRELAMAKAHLTFAETNLDQGFVLDADKHMVIAKANAHAAFDLSPPQRCAERGFVVEPLPGDRDGDGYLDPDDTCPDEPENYQGFEDGDGCPDDPDTDGDGITDSNDSCVLEPEDKDSYLDTDGCPDIDNDLDTIPDVEDKDSEGNSCADKPEDPDGFEDEDGCPDLDNDQDNVVDLEDQCPLEPGVVGGDKPGCPKKPSLVVVTDKEIKITQQIHFEFDRAKIRPMSFPILDAVVEVLEKNPKIELEVQGHTDNKGSAAYNKQLSQRRADAVVDYLVSKGISRGRLQGKGYGEERPIKPNNTEANRADNRRVQFLRVEK